ncbi:MAG: peptidase MA family metallohydrolase [Anaerolineae bacterium]|jgi:hypothetical protein
MVKRFGLGLLLLGAILSLPISMVVQAQEEFQVQTNEVTGDFPHQILFSLQAAIPTPARSVELEYSIETACNQSSVRVVPEDLETEEPGQVSATWALETRRSGTLPPGTRLWWRWHVTSESGDLWSTPTEWFTFLDTRHDWQEVSQGEITIHWYQGDPDFGQEMLEAAVEAQARLTADPGAHLEEPVDVYFYADVEELKDALVFAQEWTGGVAFADQYTILIGAGPQEANYARSTLAHEIMHLVVHQLAFNCWGDMPRWLDEGLATWAEGDMDDSQREALEKAIEDDRLLTLRGLGSSFSTSSSRAHLSYAQSYSVVRFLIDEYGREEILELLAVFREGATYDGALEQVYGLDTESLEALWRASIGAAPRAEVAKPTETAAEVPTMALWAGEPTAQAPTGTPLPSPSPSPEVGGSETPALAPAPTPTAVRAALPTPIGGMSRPPASSGGNWLWYAIGGGGLVVVGVVVVGLLRQRR